MLIFKHFRIKNYVLVLNIKPPNFMYNRFIYVAVAGAVEAVSYVLPIPMLRWMGRRTTSVVLYVVSGAALLCILAIPEGELRKRKVTCAFLTSALDGDNFTC
jgi:hypothetical protein